MTDVRPSHEQGLRVRRLRLHVADGQLWLSSAALAALLSYAELLRAYRRDDWILVGGVQWLGVVLCLSMYVLVLGLLAHAVRPLIQTLMRGREHPSVAVSICVMVAGLVVLAIIAVCSQVRGSFLAAIGCAIIGFGCAQFIAGRFLAMSVRVFCGIACGASLAGAVALVANTNAYFLNTNRSLIVYSISLATAGAAGLVGTASWYWAPNSVLRLLTAFAVVIGCGTAPLSLAQLQQRHPRSGRDTSQPNVVLIVCDALRADYCSIYGGHVPTPTFEAMAQEGACFDRCYSLAPWTVPSMFAMFASNYQPGLPPGLSRQEGIEESLYYRFDTDTTTLAELLSERGYATGAFVGNLLLNEKDGILRGFESMRLKSDHWRNVQAKTGAFGRMPFLHDVIRRVIPSIATEERMDLSRLLTLYARKFIRRNRHRPFSLWVHYMDPHAPYTPPGKFRTMDTPAEGRGNPTREDPAQNYYISLYGGEIRYVDACIGEVLRELDAQGLRDATYVCVTADHGEEFWDHGDAGHGQSLYQELVWVPLILVGPGIVPQRVSTTVSGIDVMPTLAGCVSITPPSYWRGHNLAPLLRNDRQASVPYPCFATGTATWRSKLGSLTMVVDSNYKLIRETGTLEQWLFNVVDDPEEQTDLSNECEELAKHLSSQLDEWSRSFASTLATSPAQQITPAEREEKLERLRALGYLQ